VRHGSGNTHCPAHGDADPSLTVHAKGDRVLVHCHAGCSQGDVIEALRRRGLWGTGRGASASASVPSPALARTTKNYTTGKVTRYPITELDGEVIAYHVRRDGEAGDKNLWWETPDGLRGLGGRSVDSLPLYLPPASLDPGAARALVVVEGEKAAAALAELAAELGLAVAGTVTGAASAPSAPALRPYVERAAALILWPDADEAGRRHMQRVAANLRAAGAADVRLIEWPDAPTKGDAADFVAAGGTAEDLRALLMAAVEAPEAAAQAPEAQSHEEAGATGEGAASRGRRSAADRLVELALGSAEMVKTANGRLFAIANTGDVLDLETSGAREWLGSLSWKAEEKAPSGEALTAALNVLRGFARDGRLVEVHTRVAPDCAGGIFIDLCRPNDRSAVHVTADGWRVIERPAALFYRPPRAGALPMPERGGSLDELSELTNIPPEARPLVDAWLVQALWPSGDYPLLFLRGPQGSAKSSAARLLKSLTDPDAADLRSPPRDARDLAVAARNSRVLAFDNLSSIPLWLSDALCRISTGGGYATRALYTDQDECVIDFELPVILTAVTKVIERPDLLQRAVTISLPAIPPEARRTEAELQAQVQEALPRLFGALLDRLAGAIREWPNVQLSNLPRLADFYRLGVAAERGAGEAPQFKEAFAEMEKEAAADAIEASPIGPTLLEFIRRRGEWEGTATELLGALASVNPAGPMDREWPKSPRGLRTVLDHLEIDLQRAGVRVAYRRAGHERTRLIRLEALEPRGPEDPTPRTHADGADGADGSDPRSSVWMSEREGEGGEIEGGIEDEAGFKPSASSATVRTPPPACPGCGSILAAPGDDCPDCSNPPATGSEAPLPVVRDPGDGWKAALLAALRREDDPGPSGAPGEATSPAPPPAVSRCADCGAGLAGSFERCLDCATRAVAAWKQRRQGGPT
jgi:hypothetical protein